MCHPVPPKPPQPFDCYLAQGFKYLVKDAGLNPADLPINLAVKLKNQDVIPEHIWSHFAQSGRTNQAQDIYWLYQFTQFKWVSNAEFYPGNLLSYLPVELIGVESFQVFIQFMDTEGYLKQFGLDGGRAIFDGHVRYPFVDEVFIEKQWQMISLYNLRDEAHLIDFIQGLGQRYEYLPPEVAQAFANPGIAFWVADQVETLNQGMITTCLNFDLDID